MKAIEITKHGDPEVLELKDIKLGKPGADEVTIEQKAIGLNYIDTYHRSGLYPLKLPSGLGAEGAGIITEVGSNIKTFKVGDEEYPVTGKKEEKNESRKFSKKQLMENFLKKNIHNSLTKILNEQSESQKIC